MLRDTRLRTVILFVLAATLLTQLGCGGMSAIKDEAIGINKQPAPVAPSLSVDTSDSPTASTVVSDDPLEGTWTYRGMVATGSGEDVEWSVSPNTGELIITRTSNGYTLAISEGTSKAALDGDQVVLERDFPAQGVSVRYTGVLDGDTIIGSQHTTINGAEHDDPWTAERVK